jgi:Zn-dependent protease
LVIELLQTDPRLYLVVVACGVLSIVLHELGHGFAALRQGDDTPRLLGHITWNPVVHMGWFSLGLLAVFGIGFGQTPVNPARFRSRWGDAIVSGAGPTVNLVLFAIGATVFGVLPDEAPFYAHAFFLWLGVLNVVLLLFNLLPIPPLDGSAVLSNLSPEYARFARNPANSAYFMVGMLVAFFFGGRVLFPIAERVVFTYSGWVRDLVG